MELKSQEIHQLLTNTDNLYLAQGGLGQIVAVAKDNKHVFMPALVGQGEEPSRDLMRVSLHSGRGKSAISGTPGTIDWITDPEGNALAREDYWNKTDHYELKTRVGREWKSLLKDEDDTVVEFSQSVRMKNRLEGVGKSVELIPLKGEDHWLSSSETRLAALEAMGAFLAANLTDSSASQ